MGWPSGYPLWKHLAGRATVLLQQGFDVVSTSAHSTMEQFEMPRLALGFSRCTGHLVDHGGQLAAGHSSIG